MIEGIENGVITYLIVMVTEGTAHMKLVIICKKKKGMKMYIMMHFMGQTPATASACWLYCQSSAMLEDVGIHVQLLYTCKFIDTRQLFRTTLLNRNFLNEIAPLLIDNYTATLEL